MNFAEDRFEAYLLDRIESLKAANAHLKAAQHAQKTAPDKASTAPALAPALLSLSWRGPSLSL